MKSVGVPYVTGAALCAALLSVGCGGSGKERSASTAAGATSNSLSLPEARGAHTAILLRSGDILVVGGIDASGAPMRSTVIISSQRVVRGPTLAVPRVGHTATLLESGEVLIAGGQSDAGGAQVLDTTELFDPLTRSITPGPNLAAPRTRHVALTYRATNGEQRVLLAGGAEPLPAGQQVAAPLDSAEVFDPIQGSSRLLPAPLSEAQADAAIARLDGGGILIVGGEGLTGPAAPSLFDPGSESFSTPRNVIPRAGAAVASRGAEVLVAGGESAAGLEASTELFDDATSTFAQGANLASARRDASATRVGGRIVVVGGRSGAGASDLVECLAGPLGQASPRTCGSLKAARFRHTALATGPDRLVVIGGFDAQGLPLESIEQLNLTKPQPQPAAAPAPAAPAATPRAVPAPTATHSAPPAATTGPGLAGRAGATPPRAPPANPASATGPRAATAKARKGPFMSFLGNIFSSLWSGVQSLFGSLGGGSGSGGGGFLNTLLNAAVSALTQGGGGGFKGFMGRFFQNLLGQILGGGTGGTPGSGGGTSGGLGGLLSGLLGGLLGGGTGGTPGGGGSSGGLGGLLSGLLGGLTGGGSGGTGGGGSGGLGGLLSGLLGGLLGGGTPGGTGGGGTPQPPASGGGTPPAPPATNPPTTPPASGNLTITNMTPNSGPIGTTVTITGTGFGSTVGVAFNTTPAQISSATLGAGGVVTIVCTVPQGATSGAVVVVSGGNQASAGTFTVQ